MNPTQELLARWEVIPDDVRTEALNGGWYRESRRTARAMARKHGTTLATAAGVIAALSPRLQWKVNVRGAEAILGGANTGPGFEMNVKKAIRIRDGERPLKVLGGDKVRAFYRAIMGDKDAAVVDVWMHRAMGIEVGSTPYAVMAGHLREAALQAGVDVATFQAVVWTHERGKAE